jgi:DNA primase
MSELDEIKARIDIIELIGESVQLRRAGKNYTGFVLFTQYAHPAFYVFPDTGTWHCFSCNEGEIFLLS